MSMSTSERPRSGLAVGFIVFAGVAMVMIGALHALQGLVALFNDDFYVVGQEWIFEFALTTTPERSRPEAAIPQRRCVETRKPRAVRADHTIKAHPLPASSAPIEMTPWAADSPISVIHAPSASSHQHIRCSCRR